MSFSENLRVLRQEKNISQEQLADMLNVSRQAVSKWEQDSGYPETEKLIQIARKLDVSLDSLLLDKQLVSESDSERKGDIIISPADRKIAIQYNSGKNMSEFYKFRIHRIKPARKGRPQHVLIGIDGSTFLGGDNIVGLGFYMTHEDAQKELIEINEAMQNNEITYQLKYASDARPGWLISII